MLLERISPCLLLAPGGCWEPLPHSFLSNYIYSFKFNSQVISSLNFFLDVEIRKFTYLLNISKTKKYAKINSLPRPTNLFFPNNNMPLCNHAIMNSTDMSLSKLWEIVKDKAICRERQGAQSRTRLRD